MNTDWVTLQSAIVQLNFKGVQNADYSLETAINSGEIETRDVKPDSSRTSWESTELIELRRADFEKWVGKFCGVNPVNTNKEKRGRPPIHDKHETVFWIEVTRRIFQDGMPETCSDLVASMEAWCSDNLKHGPKREWIRERIAQLWKVLQSNTANN